MICRFDILVRQDLQIKFPQGIRSMNFSGQELTNVDVSIGHVIYVLVYSNGYWYFWRKRSLDSPRKINHGSYYDL